VHNGDGPRANQGNHANIIILVTDHCQTDQACESDRPSTTINERSSMLSALLNAAKFALPAAGPATIIVPTVLYVIACRKFEFDLSFSTR
jgi:hypothetical protein